MRIKCSILTFAYCKTHLRVGRVTGTQRALHKHGTLAHTRPLADLESLATLGAALAPLTPRAPVYGRNSYIDLKILFM
ncbi:hypothetical protein DPMN_061769 [Dreissena polymorpha]|uniref:Uncharacterized protein n=1 Tax=Dreissena polymorpha TaxID=45954 RepID=A0A9D4C867_DREPO|nr:hypothetical protein DPMN_061769 [Dreissena polymorpha]